MQKEYILFIDSGIGGLSTLAEAYIKLPRNFIYYADTKHHPYGSREGTEIFEYLKDIIVSTLKKYYVKVVVLACNTATTSAIVKLRNTFLGLTFIGTEPAIKLAHDMGYNNILSLCTPVTARQQKYLCLAQKLQTKIRSLSLPNLAFDIEQFLIIGDISARLNLTKDLFFIKQQAKGFDAIVLGCTHYALIARSIATLTGLPMVDGNAGVARQVFLCCNNKVNHAAPKSNKFRKNLTSNESVESFVNFACKNNLNKQINFDSLIKQHNCLFLNEFNVSDQLPDFLTNNIKQNIVFLFSKDNKVLKQKYIKIFKQILANKLNL